MSLGTEWRCENSVRSARRVFPFGPKGPLFAHMDGDARAFARGQLLDTISVSVKIRALWSDQTVAWSSTSPVEPNPTKPLKSRAAHRRVLRLCSQESLPGEIMAIMHVLARGLIKLSRKTCEKGFCQLPGLNEEQLWFL